MQVKVTSCSRAYNDPFKKLASPVVTNEVSIEFWKLKDIANGVSYSDKNLVGMFPLNISSSFTLNQVLSEREMKTA